METVIEIKNLAKAFKVRQNKHLIKGIFNPNYKMVTAVNNITFSIERGEAVAFLGPNGAGKTTTTKMLTGLIYPSEGEVNVLGFTPSDRERNFLMRIGLVMGNKSGLNWDLSANQSFQLLQQIYKIPNDAFTSRIKELTELLNVEHLLESQIRRLSLGERMKMELIGAILHNPEVLFLDEPTIGLDITAKKNIRLFLKNIQKNSNITLILTSHDMDDIEQVCERVIVINKGEKVYDDQLSNLTSLYKQSRFVKFIFENKPRRSEFIPVGEILEEADDSYLFKVDNQDMPKLIADVTAKFNVIDIDILSIPLEEMIEDIFKRSSK
jgi:ABC-2 type transport system ATP-binding protein